jgi:hypothetical protein
MTGQCPRIRFYWDVEGERGCELSGMSQMPSRE